ncbi:MAG: 16S rRNA (cytosine(1402)-N(4))-methyltransferase RsmH [Sediminibacterium sp.]|nr:16S rRNA (cytosine(1402)-N(4))-methyltransferase RsmH [Sediminibacterium sp.]
MINSQHQTVLLNESIDQLGIKPDGVYIDATFGGGGHSKGILKKLNHQGRLIAFDQDDSVSAFGINDERFTLISENFEHIALFINHLGIQEVDGILADLGFSSIQLDNPERGFSYKYNSPFDMRMNCRQKTTAKDILLQKSEKELADMFMVHSQIPNARKLAAYIVQNRQHIKLDTSFEIMEWLGSFIIGQKEKYWSQFFQAFRMEVNQEIKVLNNFLHSLTKIVKQGGVVAIITFHSVEDKIVKNYFKSTVKNLEKDLIFGFKKSERQIWQLLSQKAILPSESEIKMNNRARSAKLRVAKLINKNGI